MEILFIAERVHKRSFMSVRAYQLIFTDTQIYFVNLGEDSSQMPIGAAGGIGGAIVQSISDKISEKNINKRLEELKSGQLDKAIINDKYSFKARYAQIESFEYNTVQTTFKWICVKFKIRERGKYRFTAADGELCEKIADIIRQKRPDLMR